MDIFQQILDLDDDEEHEYSRELACAFFVQARTAFADMDKAYAKKDLKELASLGHFLKGSSAALGVTRVSSSCQKIEHYGHLRDPSASSSYTWGSSHSHSHSHSSHSSHSSCHSPSSQTSPSSSSSSLSSTSSSPSPPSHRHHHHLTQEEALAKIGALLRTVGKETNMAEEWLKRWYVDEARRWEGV
jgi:osomolarity two-component system phosphorelay intermediate protein YPD1